MYFNSFIYLYTLKLITMKRSLFTIALMFVLTGIFAQSDNMNDYIWSTENELLNNGYDIIFSDYADINKYNEIFSETITLRPLTDYQIILFVDDCSSCEPNIFFLYNGEEYKIRSNTVQLDKVTKLTKKSYVDEPRTLKVIGKTDSQSLHKCYLLIAKNENMNP